MTWTRAALYWAVCLALSAYYLAAVREPAEPVARHGRAPFLDLPADQIDALDLRRGTTVVRCRRAGGRWVVTEPTDRPVPSDLIEALVATVTQSPDVEVVAEDSRALDEFGLQDPQSELTLRHAGATPLRIRLGARNPAGTAVYAQRTDSPKVFLIGLNVRYYEDLVFEALAQHGPGRGE